MSSRRRPSRASAGLSMVEVVLSFVVISLMLFAALDAVAASRRTVAIAERNATARFLADELLAYIFAKAYADPSETAVFGREPSESSAGKTGLDDVDDFDGWLEDPLQDCDGTKMLAYVGWARSVTVERVLPESPSTVKTAETGAKRITVIVKLNGAEYGRAVAIRTNAPSPKSP